MTKKLAIISSHPIQYYAPLFQLLAKQIELKVFYTLGESSLTFDPGFNRKIEWDLPLLKGYHYQFLKNISKAPGTHDFKGIVNPSIIKEINDYHPDALLIYGWAFKSHLNVLRAFKNNIPIYFRGDSTLLKKQSLLKKISKKIFLSWVYSHVQKAFYVGKANKAYFKEYGLTEEQLCFAPHSIDNKRFSTDRSTEATQLRDKLGITKEENLVLFAGKFDPVKNPKILIQAFLESKIPNTHLLLVGNGVLEESLKLEAIAQGTKDDKVNEKVDVASRVHFMDFQNQSQMPVIYQACDLFCLPSKSETWGLAANEAMAAGKAIIVSDKVGCASDLVIPQVNGDIFISEDLTDLKSKLLSLVQNKDQLIKMGKESEKIIKNWSFDVQVKSIVKSINLL